MKRLAALLALAGLIAGLGSASASSIVEHNPFDPQRKMWPPPPPPPPPPPAPLPQLTPQDIAVEAIILFGDYRGILAQLSGKLKDALPANAAGKVRIAIGQTFGPGYVLERVEPNQVVVTGRGGSTSVIPLVRRTVSGAPPAAAAAPLAHPFIAAAPAPAEPAAPVPPPPPAGEGAHPPPAPTTGGAPAGGDGAAAAAPNAQAAPPAQPAQQPMTLLDAIRAAQERAKQSGAAPTPKLPFGGP